MESRVDFFPEEPAQNHAAGHLNIGGYKLGGCSSALHNVEEFSAADYGRLPRTFKGESIWRSPEANHIGTPWQKWEILVATVDEFIYKVQAGRIISADDQANLGEILSLLAFCKSVYGEPANGKNGIYVWDTSEGNIVLHIEKLQRLQLGVTITATSKNTVFFERLSSGQRHHDPLGPAPVTPAQRPRLNAVEHYLRQTELHAGPEKPESDGAFAFAAKFIFNLAVGLFFAYAAGRFIGLFWPLWGYPVTLMLAAFWILSSARRLRERWAGKI